MNREAFDSIVRYLVAIKIWSLIAIIFGFSLSAVSTLYAWVTVLILLVSHGLMSVGIVTFYYAYQMRIRVDRWRLDYMREFEQGDSHAL